MRHSRMKEDLKNSPARDSSKPDSRAQQATKSNEQRLEKKKINIKQIYSTRYSGAPSDTI